MYNLYIIYSQITRHGINGTLQKVRYEPSEKKDCNQLPGILTCGPLGNYMYRPTWPFDLPL